MKLLIQACSGRKIATEKPCPALELYDGTAFRVIKKYLREESDQTRHPKIIILSAEYGLIRSEKKIPTYDRLMTRERAGELETQISAFWTELIKSAKFEDVFINFGKVYLLALEGLSFPICTEFASGGIGYRNRQLKEWLNGKIANVLKDTRTYIPTD